MDLSRNLFDKIENDFGAFLLRFRTEESAAPFYVLHAKQMRSLGSRTLLVDFQHLTAANAEESTI